MSSQRERRWRRYSGDSTLNVNAFENVDPSLLRKTPVTFDGESEADRLARRKRNWIAAVRFDEAGSWPATENTEAEMATQLTARADQLFRAFQLCTENLPIRMPR